MATPSTTLTISSSPIPNGHYEPSEEEELYITDENKPSFTACYEWKLPAFTYNYIDKLTDGYLRLESKKYSLYVPRDITATCMTYFYDLNVTNSIKTASNGKDLNPICSASVHSSFIWIYVMSPFPCFISFFVNNVYPKFNYINPSTPKFFRSKWIRSRQ